MRAAPGFTLIEIAITLAVLALLITAALPSFTTWIMNSKIRTQAEAITNGVQLARAEAVRQNLNAQLVLGGASGASEWTVSTVGSGGVLSPVQTRTAAGADATVVATTPGGAATITFNGLGRVVGNGDGTPSITQVDVCSTSLAAADMRKMRVIINTGGSIRMCDPQVAAGDPRACPAGGVSGC